MKKDLKIVILHGWMHNKEMWEPIVSKFPEGSAIALDLPGFGEEPIISYDWGVKEYSDWIMEKIETLGYKNVLLVGHSFGGRVASYSASRNPKWLKGVILIAAPSIYNPAPSVKFQNKIAPIIKTLSPTVLIKKLAPLFTVDDYRDVRETRMKTVYENVVRCDQRDALPNISIPVLMLWGENDQDVLLDTQKEMKLLIPNSEFQIIPNAGHNLHLEAPDLLYGKIKQFAENIE